MGKIENFTAKFKTQFAVNIVVLNILIFVTALFIINIFYNSIYILTGGNEMHYYTSDDFPRLRKFVKESNDSLLSPSFKDELEKALRVKGVRYQVVDDKGNIIYGSLKTKVYNTLSEFHSNVNTFTESEDKKGNYEFTLTYPVLDKSGNIKGGIIIKHYEYKLNFNFLQAEIKIPFQNKLIKDIFSAVHNYFIIIYLIIVAFIYGKIMGNKIEEPVLELIEAAKRISDKDLDFEITYNSKNEIGQLADAFRTMKTELQKSLYDQWKVEEDRKEMIKVIAHDLKTPVTVIQGHIEVLEENPGSFNQRYMRYLSIIKENAGIISSMVSEINIVSELEKADFTLKPVKIDISEFLESKDFDYTILCRKNQINFEFDIQDKREANIELEIDPMRLEQILNNIISNAIRFTPQGKKIRASAEITEHNLCFVIQDEGEGFKEEELPYIFEKFYRGDVHRNIEKGHCGLGLYITKKLIEMHRGTIKADNAETGGARLTFNIRSFSL